MKNIIKIVGTLSLITFSFSFYKAKKLSLNPEELISETKKYELVVENLQVKEPVKPKLSKGSSKRDLLLNQIKLEQYQEDLAEYIQSLDSLNKNLTSMKMNDSNFDTYLNWVILMSGSGLVCCLYLIVFLYRFFFK